MDAIAGHIFRPLLPSALVFVAAFSSVGIAFAQSSGGSVNLALTTSPSVGQSAVTALNLIGTNYPSGTISAGQVQITLTPAKPGTGSTVSFPPSSVTTVFASSRRLTFTIPSSVSVASPVPYLVSVSGRTTAGISFSSANSSALTINPPAQIVSVSPNSASAGQSLTVRISSKYTNFFQGSTVASFGPGISVGGAPSGSRGPVTVVDQSTATVQLVVDGNAAPGTRTVSIQTGVQIATVTNGFTVGSINQPPVVSAGPNQTVTPFTDEFEGPSINPFWTLIGPGTANLTSSMSHSGKQSLQLAAVPTYPWWATARHDFGSQVSGSVSAWINGSQLCCGTAASLGIDDTSDTWLATLEQSQDSNCLSCFTARVNGSPESDYRFTASATDWHLYEIDTGPSGVTFKFDGAIIFTNPSVTNFRAVDFTVWSAPSGTGYFDDFSSSVAETTLNGSLTDDGLPMGATLTGTWTVASGPGSVSFSNSTQTFPDVAGKVNPVVTSATFSAPGSYILRLTGSDSKLSSSATVTITVNPPTTTILLVNPNSGQQGQQKLSVAITGLNTHFVQGKTSASFGAGITVASLTVNSATSATAVLNIDAAAAVGPRDVTLTTGTEAATLANGFAVQPGVGLPLITTITPDSGQQGQQKLSVAITGQSTHFVQRTTTASFGAGITVASLTVNSATSATAVLNIGANATVGSLDVTLSTGTEVVTLPAGFTVALAPLTVSAGPPQTIMLPGPLNLNGSVTGPAGDTFTTSWTQISGPAQATFSNQKILNPTVSFPVFSDPGIYVFRLRATDGVRTGSNDVSITVTFCASGKEEGVRDSSGYFSFVNTSDGRLRMYDGDIQSLISTDGVEWSQEPGARVTPANGLAYVFAPDVVPVSSGGFRMYYIGDHGGPPAGDYIWRIYSAFSPDGLNWTPEPGIRVDVGGPNSCNFLYTPQVIQVTGGELRMYYTCGFSGDSNGAYIASSSSTDGLTWSPDAGIRVSPGPNLNALTPFVQGLPDGRLRMFYSSTTVVNPQHGDIYSAISADGLSWTKEAGIRIQAGAQSSYTGGFLQGQGLVPLADGTFRLYYIDQSVYPNAYTESAHWCSVGPTNPPSLVAGANQTITLPINTVALQGIESDDKPSGTQVLYRWTSVSGPGSVKFSNTSALTTNAQFPTPGQYRLRLTAFDTRLYGYDDLTVTVLSPTSPALLSVSPNSGTIGSTGVSVALTGQATHFASGTQVDFGPGITVTGISVSSPTTLTAQLSIDPAAVLGTHTVTATTGTEVVSLPDSFLVTEGTNLPSVSTVSPNSGQQGQQDFAVTITGQNTNFASGKTTASFGAGITVASLTVNSATSATAILNIDANAAVGSRDVTLTTGSEVAIGLSAFSVVAGAPSITTVSPTSGPQGGSGPVGISALNTHFAQGKTQVSFGAGITVSNINVGCPTCLQVTLTIDAAAALGPRTVTVTTGSEVVSLPNGFTVTSSGTAPILTSIVPDRGQQGQSGSIAITGNFTHFAQKSTQVSFGAGITVTSVSVSSATGLKAQIAIDPAAAPGLRTVTVTTGSEVASVPDVFHVKPGTPIIHNLNPGGGQQGQQNLAVAIVGEFTHFVQATTQASFGAGITVVSLTVGSPTTATAVVNIAGTATLGTRTVTLTTGSEVASFTNGFTIGAPTPTIHSLDPGGTSQGAQKFSVAIAGFDTHWVQGSTVARFGAGIRVISVTVADPTTATAVINVDVAAAIGPRTVTLTTGSEAASFINGFKIVAGVPGITEINPGGGPQGAQNLSLAVTAQFTHWVQGATQVNFGTGVTVASLTITSLTAATAVVNVSASAALGARDVTFTTGAEVEKAPGGFTVSTGAATLTQVSPNKGQQGQQNLSVTLTGQLTHFAQGTTQVFFGPNIIVASSIVNSPTSVTAMVNVEPSAASGAREVAVQTGTEVVVLNNGFTVTVAPPVLLSVGPATGQQGQRNLSVIIAAQYTHFAQGATMASFGAGITVTSLTVNSVTSAIAALNVGASAAIGSHSVTMTTGSEVVTLGHGFTVMAGGQPSMIDIEFSQDIAPAGASIMFSATPRDAGGVAYPGTPSCSLTSDASAASGPVPTLGATSIATSPSTRGIYLLTCTLSAHSLTAGKAFTVIAPTGPGTTQPGLFGTFSSSINSAGQTVSAIVAALQTNNPGDVNTLLTQLRAARDAVDYDALDRSTPFAPEAGFPASPEQLPSFGIDPGPQDSNVGPYLNDLIAQLNSLTTFLQTHPLAALSSADQITYTQLQSGLSTLALQLTTLDPSAYGVVANEGMWNLLGADALPQYFQALANATDQLLTTNGYTGTAERELRSQLDVPSVTVSLDLYLRGVRPEILGISLEDLTFASALQLQLIQQIYGQYFNYLYKAVATLTAAQAFQSFIGGLTLDGVITGASLSFDIFHAGGSIIESSVVNLIPKRNDVYLVGPNFIGKIQDLLSSFKKPKNEDELFQEFQDIVDKLNAVGESYQEAHQLPDSTTDFCILGNSPPCNQAVYSNGFNSVYASGGLPLPAPVLILVHNLDGSQAATGLLGSGVFDFLPSN